VARSRTLSRAGALKLARNPTVMFFSVSRPLGQSGLAATKDGVAAARFAPASSRPSNGSIQAAARAAALQGDPIRQ